MKAGWTPKRYPDWSIKTKLLTITALLLLASVFVESYLSYRQYTGNFEKQSAGKVQQIIEQVGFNIGTYMDDLYRLTLFPYRNAQVMAALEDRTVGTELDQLEKRRLIENYLDEIMIYPRKDIIRVSILTDTIYSSARFPSSVVPNDAPDSYDWYREALQTQDYIFVPGSRQPGPAGKVDLFSVVKQLRSTRNTQDIIGVIKADANYDGIVDICSKAEMGRDGGLYIVDGKNEFIYATNDRFRSLVLEAPGGDTGAVRDGYLINTAAIPKLGWRIVAVNSVAEMNRDAVQTRNRAFLLAVVGSMLAIVVLVLFVRRFLQPLLAIVKLMKAVERGQLDVRFRNERRDEIGYLGAAFNRLVANIADMLDANTRLVREVYEAKLLQKEAQVNALHSQIRPHFLFNTLNLISLTMQSGQQEKAIDHINRLSSLLRGMSSWDREIPLAKELELLHAYLGIQSSRYEGRLAYAIEVPETYLGRLVPSLLLQPIVENAVIHGCERRKAKTTIRIRAEAADDRLLLVVQDYGAGMDADTLARLRERLARPEESGEEPEAGGAAASTADGGAGMSGAGAARGNARETGIAGGNAAGTGARAPGAGSGGSAAGTGIGLVNADRRVKAKYGPAYGLTIDSRAGEGTIVCVSLPLEPNAKENE